jgi:type I restriction enzyme S subunit
VNTLPSGWDEATLGEIVTPSRDPVAPHVDEIRPYLGLEHVEPHTTRILSLGQASTLSSTTLAFEPGDILYGRLRPYLNKVCSPDFSGLASAEFMVFKPSPLLAPKYLLYLLSQSEFVSFASSVSEGDRPRVKWSQIADFRVPLAPFAEQRRIVAAIEEQFSRLDVADASLRRAARRVTVLRQSILDRCGAVDDRPVGPLVRGLRDPLVNGRSVPTAERGFPVLRLNALRQGRVDVRRAKVGAWSASDAEPFLVKEGDFLIARGNGSRHLVGRGGLVDQSPPPVAFPDTVIRIRVDEELLRRRYLRLIWDSRLVRQQIERQARTTAGIYKINQNIVRSIQLPFPPVEEQDRVALVAEQQLSVLDALGARLGVALRRGEALRRSVVKLAFTGRLVPHDTTNEPGSALLNRVAASQSASTKPPQSRRRRVPV